MLLSPRKISGNFMESTQSKCELCEGTEAPTELIEDYECGDGETYKLYLCVFCKELYRRIPKFTGMTPWEACHETTLFEWHMAQLAAQRIVTNDLGLTNYKRISTAYWESPCTCGHPNSHPPCSYCSGSTSRYKE